MTKDEAIEQFLKFNSIHYSPNTLRSYQVVINQFSKFFPDITNVEDFKPPDVTKFLNHFLDKNCEPMGIRHKSYALRAYFLTLSEMNKLIKNPMRSIKIPKMHQNILPIVSYQNMYKLREVSRDNVRDRTIIELLWASGVRVEELCNMKVSDVHLDGRFIFVPKSKNYLARNVLFTPSCKEWLKEYLAQRKSSSPYLFPSPNVQEPLHTTSIRGVIKKYLEIAGIVENITPHSFRRSFAAILYKAKVPVDHIAKLMGHIVHKTTYRYAIYAEFI